MKVKENVTKAKEFTILKHIAMHLGDLQSK